MKNLHSESLNLVLKTKQEGQMVKEDLNIRLNF